MLRSMASCNEINNTAALHGRSASWWDTPATQMMTELAAQAHWITAGSDGHLERTSSAQSCAACSTADDHHEHTCLSMADVDNRAYEFADGI